MSPRWMSLVEAQMSSREAGKTSATSLIILWVGTYSHHMLHLHWSARPVLELRHKLNPPAAGHPHVHRVGERRLRQNGAPPQSSVP